MKRKRRLKQDPEAIRAWQQRSARPLSRSTELRRGLTPLQRSRPSDRLIFDPQENAKAAVRAWTAWEWKKTVLQLDQGRCVNCGAGPFFIDQDRWVWQAHHPLAKQRLPEELKWDPRNGVVLCRRCHERHESRTAVVPGEKLPGRCWEFAETLGAWAVDLLERAHPTTAEVPDGNG